MTPCRLRPWIPLTFTVLLLTIVGMPGGAETVVTIESPLLKSGMTNLQAMIAQSSAEFAGDIAILVDDTIDKPDFLAGTSFAAAQASLVPSSAPGSERPSVALGSAAAYYSPWLSTSAVSNLDDLDAKSDLDAGACIEPLVVQVGLPLDFLVRGLAVSANAGYMKADSGAFGIRSVTAGLSASYRLIKPGRGAVAWSGLALCAGGDFVRQNLDVTVESDTISEVIPIDPDGAGPLSSFDATVSVNPVIHAGVETTLVSGHLGATTGITLFRALTFFAGAGATAGWAVSSITIESRDPVAVTGYLGDLIEKPGTIGVSGTADEHRTGFVRPYVSGGLELAVGTVTLTIPVSYKPFDSIGTGVFIGVRL